MKILVDIGHPGHVHLFRNMILMMQKQGHEFLVTARDKEVSHALLDTYGISFQSRGKGYRGILGKALGMLGITLRIARSARRFNADLLVGGVGNLYIALAGWLLRKPSVIFDDTEHAAIELWVVKRFATVILTPDVYKKDLGRTQIRYAGYHEWAYLHPRYFKPDQEVISRVKQEAKKDYVVIRFVSWGAAHDVGHRGMSDEEKVQLVEALSLKFKVLISSEGLMPEALQQYRLRVHPAEMHSVLAGASLFIGEGATMASESVCAGTPAIYINPLVLGYCAEQEEHGLLFHLTGMREVLLAADRLSLPEARLEFRHKHQQLFSKKIDVTRFMCWFLENFPASVSLMKGNANAQKQFME